MNYIYDELDRLDRVFGAYSQKYEYDEIGNIIEKDSLTYEYDDPDHVHAVTSVSNQSPVDSYEYDDNGNMITRVEGGLTYNEVFDAENRLISVTVNGQTTQFLYDGDGNLVKKIQPNGSRTLYVGGVYEVEKASGGSVTKMTTYYPAAGAMRIKTDAANNDVYYILKDHLGSASVVADESGAVVGEQRYYPFGETRWSTGNMLTDKLFTGQREMAGLRIYHYGARFYSPKLGRFLSADTIVPGYANPQNLNRYSYTLNNPIRYNDPSGHCVDVDDGLCVRQTKNKTYRVVHGGKVFRNRVEVAFANHYFSGGDPSYIENLPSENDSGLIKRTAMAVGSYWGYSNFNPNWDLALDPSVPAGVTVGLATAFSWRPGQSPQIYIKGLEGVDQNAHAWDKHGPDASDANLLQQSLKSSSPQTKFTSGDEMANAVSSTLAVNMEEIVTAANSGEAGSLVFFGPNVNYSGYYKGTGISGQAITKVVINYNGNGGWNLQTAIPWLYPSTGGR